MSKVHLFPISISGFCVLKSESCFYRLVWTDFYATITFDTFFVIDVPVFNTVCWTNIFTQTTIRALGSINNWRPRQPDSVKYLSKRLDYRGSERKTKWHCIPFYCLNLTANFDVFRVEQPLLARKPERRDPIRVYPCYLSARIIY